MCENQGVDSKAAQTRTPSGNPARDALIDDLQSTIAEQQATIADLRDELREAERLSDRADHKIEAQHRLLTETIRKYERAVHERNMVEQGTLGYRAMVGAVKKVLPTPLYFRLRKLVRGT